MAGRSASLEVDGFDLEALFETLDIWVKISDQRLSTEIIIGTQRSSWGYPGGVSEIIRHRNRLGYHVATTHWVRMRDGSIPHWHGKDIRFSDALLYTRSETPS